MLSTFPTPLLVFEAIYVHTALSDLDLSLLQSINTFTQPHNLDPLGVFQSILIYLNQTLADFHFLCSLCRLGLCLLVSKKDREEAAVEK